MTKTKKLWLALVVLAVVIVAYVLITSLTEEQTPNVPISDAGQTQSYSFFTLNANELTAFSYVYNGQEYAYTLSEDQTCWTWDEDPTIPLSNSSITLMMNAVLTLSSEYRYEGVASDALDDYGLGETAQRVHFTYADGTGEGLIFGKINAFNSLAYCCLASDPSTVYMVSAGILPYFTTKPSSMIVDDELPTYTQEQLIGFELEKNGERYLYLYEYLSDTVEAEDEKELVYYPDGGDSEPLDHEVRDTMIAAMLDWYLDDAATFDPERYGEYGVSDDTANRLLVQYTFTQSYTDETTGTTNSTELQTMYTLLLGNTNEDGLTYVRLSDQTGVYALDLSAILALAE